MSDELRGLLVFARLAETMSFSKTGAQLGMTRSAVSKHIVKLEAQLGVQLLVRTTRKLALTDAGERVRPMARQIAESLELSREAARSHSDTMVGHLRIAAPSQLGRSYVTALMARFLTLHPQLSAELVLGDAYVDLVGERVDVALRVGRKGEADLIARRISKVEMLLCASPDYLARRGAPRSPAQLTGHEWINHVPNSVQNRITFHRGGRALTVQVTGRLTCNDGAGAVEAAVQGFGLVMAPVFELAEQVKAGALVRVLPGWQLGEMALHAVSPPRRHVSSRVRTFIDYVVQEWRSPPWRLA